VAGADVRVALLLMYSLLVLLVVPVLGILDRPAFVYLQHARATTHKWPMTLTHCGISSRPESDTPFSTMDDPFNVVKE
jgi:hypothetical protein